MKKDQIIQKLTPRERQVMDIVYRFDKATAVDVVNNLPGKPVNATVRSILRTLEGKGYLNHETVKGTFIYFPTAPARKVGTSAMKHLVDTFFQGSVSQAFFALMDITEGELSEQEKDQIEEKILEARETGR